MRIYVEGEGYYHFSDNVLVEYNLRRLLDELLDLHDRAVRTGERALADKTHALSCQCYEVLDSVS